MSDYGEVLDKFDSYDSYQEKKLKDKAFKSDFINKLKRCSNLIKVTNNNLFMKLNGSRLKYSKERLGEPLLFLKKLTIMQWIFFILTIFLTTLFYVLMFGAIKDIITIDNFFSLDIIMSVFGIIAGIYLYFLSICYSTNFVQIYFTHINSDNFTKLIKLFPVFIFPFNKFTTDNFTTYFILGEKGMLVYSSTSDLYTHSVYSYIELLDNKYTYWDISDFLDRDCQEKVFELARKYYGS